MKWIGQHIYDLASRFRSDVYLEDISTGTIASGAHLGLDSNNKIVKAVDGGGDLTSIIAGTGLSGDNLSGPIPELTVDASQPGITTLAGVSAIGTAGTPIVITSDAVTFQSVNADDPIVTIKNTSNAANDMASLKFVKDRGAAPAVNDNLAEIYFIGEDSGQNSQEYGRILCETDVVTDGQESGRLKLGVANHDGGNGYGLTMQGGSEDGEVDVTIGLGSNSVVTVPGKISGNVTGNVTGNVSGSSGSCTGEADTVATIAGLAPNTATTQATQAAITTCANLVTVGTIDTGVWNGTAIASAYLDADTMHYSAQRQLTHHTIQDDIDTQVVFLSLAEYDGENTVISNNKLPLTAPVAGKLLKVFVRSTANVSGVDFTWKLYTRTSSQSTNGNAAEIGAQTGTGPTNANMVTYDFTTGLDSGTNVIGAGDKVQISLETDGSTSNSNYFITLLWEWDLS